MLRTPPAHTSFWYNGMMLTEAQSLWTYSQAGGDVITHSVVHAPQSLRTFYM